MTAKKDKTSNIFITFIAILGKIKLWFIVCLFLLVILIKAVALPYLLEPITKEALDRLSQIISERTGQEVNIGFSNLEVSLGIRSAFMIVDQPSLSINDEFIGADKAYLVFNYRDLPVLVVDQAKVNIQETEDNQLIFGGITPEFINAFMQLASSDTLLPNELQSDLVFLPSKFIASNTQISYTNKNNKITYIPTTTFAIRNAAELEMFHVFFNSDLNDPWKFFGRINLPFDLANNDTEFYLEARYFENFIRQANLDFNLDNPRLELWGTYSTNNELSLASNFRFNNFAYEFNSDPHNLDNQNFDSYFNTRSAAVIIDTKINNPLSNDVSIETNWKLNARSITVQLATLFIDDEVAIDILETSGNINVSNNSFAITANNILIDGPVGTGKFDIAANNLNNGTVSINLVGSSPNADFAKVAKLFPSSLSEAGARFIRNDIQSNRSNLKSIVVSGDDITKFPWPDNEGGIFELQANLYDATLNYADDFPNLINADGGLRLFGNALAVTIIGGTSDAVTLSIAKAGIDDLTTEFTTLHIALNAHLPNGSLFDVLSTVPETRAKTQNIYEVIQPSGAQDLNLNLAIPLIEGDAIINGDLNLLRGNSFVYTPTTMTVDNILGQIDFDNTSATGILLANALDTGVRISVFLDNETTNLVVDGNFDIKETLEKLNRPTTLPISGSTALNIKIDDEAILVTSNLKGIDINLPDPLGKVASEEKALSLAIIDEDINITYDGGFINANLHDDATAVGIGFLDLPPELPASGTNVAVELNNIDLDSILPTLIEDDDGEEIEYPLNLSLSLPNANFLGMLHNNLSIATTIAASATVVTFASENLAGNLAIKDPSIITVSLEFLNIAEAEKITVSDSDIIYIEPGTITPNLPTLNIYIATLNYGSLVYADINIAGKPMEDKWILDEFTSKIGNNHIRITGETNTANEPFTSLNVFLTMDDIRMFVNDYFDSESVSSGSGSISGKLNWESNILDPHYYTMTGNLRLITDEMVITRGSGGVRLLNLLSPFTFLNTLPNLGIDGTKFDNTTGEFVFDGGDLIIESLHMQGDEINISVSGKTNLITEYNDIHYEVEVESTNTLTAGAVAVANPLAGALLLVFDKVLNTPLLGKVNFNYDVTGTWDEPIIELESQSEVPSEDN